MLASLQSLWRVCRDQASPADLPYSIPLLMGLFCINIGLVVFQYTYHVAFSDAVILASVKAGILLVFTMGILWLRGLAGRFIQTSIALVGAQVLVYALMIPILLLQPWFLGEVEPTGVLKLLLMIVLLYLLVLNIALLVITARIYRRSMDVSYGQGLLLAIVLQVIEIFVLNQLI